MNLWSTAYVTGSAAGGPMTYPNTARCRTSQIPQIDHICNVVYRTIRLRGRHRGRLYKTQGSALEATWLPRLHFYRNRIFRKVRQPPDSMARNCNPQIYFRVCTVSCRYATRATHSQSETTLWRSTDDVYGHGVYHAYEPSRGQQRFSDSFPGFQLLPVMYLVP
jgi:hypothetical protein